jgi:hypothetical protein
VRKTAIAILKMVIRIVKSLERALQEKTACLPGVQLSEID